jgi:hypothetical protein
MISVIAGEPKRYGFLNVVNLIPSKLSCDINLAGKSLVPDGLKSAVETGWFMVPVGSHTITINHSNHKKHSSKLSVIENVSNIIVIYLHSNERLKEDVTPFSPEIRIAEIAAFESKGFSLKALSMFPGASRFQLASEGVELEYLKITDLPKWTGGGFQIQYNGNPIGEVARGRERASYLLLLGSDHQGNYLTVIANADPQKLPPWMGESP